MNPPAPYTVLTRSVIATTTTDDFPAGTSITELETYSVWDLVDGVKPVDAPANIAISAATSLTTHPTRHWQRRPGTGFDTYKYQTAYHVDPVNGNNANSGVDADHALATTTEWRLRVWQDQRADMVMYIHGDCDGCYRGFSSEYGLRIEGVPTELAKTSSATVAYNSSSGVNESNTLTDNAGLAWAAYLGKFIKSGTKYAAILKDLTAGRARLGQWNDSSGNTDQSPPAAGAYTILSLPLITVGPNDGASTGQEQFDPGVTYVLCKVDAHDAFVFNANYLLCEFDVTENVYGLNRFLKFSACSFHTTGKDTNVAFAGGVDLTGTTFLRSSAIVSNNTAELGGCTLQDAQVKVRNGGHVNVTTGPFSVFDYTSEGAIQVEGDGSFREFYDTVFGKGNGYALRTKKNGQARFSGTPTITGGTEVSIANGTPFPAFTPGAAVPNTSALATWANLSAAPYNGFAQTTVGGIIDTN